MLFNSYTFVFLFLPVVLLGHELAAFLGRSAVVVWLLLASLAFYAYWQPAFLFILCGSILFNYTCGKLIHAKTVHGLRPKVVLYLAITGNLLLLMYFKYLFPLLSFLAPKLSISEGWSRVLLPLGISFFTFTQIAFLVDLEQGTAQLQNLASYGLFVTFFPHLIAGPILHHGEMMPQFQQERDYRLRADDLAIGASLFAMGLAKKVLLADRFAPMADRVFATHFSVPATSAWCGVLSYALQLYFDFSGYSDMAIGLGRMFSIEFPLNFDSPYKSANIIDFWQRWHMTLTRYIMTYLYNPISISIYRKRVSQGRSITKKALSTAGGFASMVAIPTMITLFLAGVWHGAGWQFMIFGLLHAFYLSWNHAWRLWSARVENERWTRFRSTSTWRVLSTLLTMVAVLVAQVFFRASGTSSALGVLAAMIGLQQKASQPAGLHPGATSIALLVVGYAIVWFAPNTQQILGRFKPALSTSPGLPNQVWPGLRWEPSALWAAGLGVILVLTIVKMQSPSTFLYFQF